MTTCNILLEAQDIILQRWTKLARARVVAAQQIDKVALENSIPEFFQSLCKELNHTVPGGKADAIKVAREHGEERVELGNYDISEVLYEYMLLRQVIIEYLEEKGELPKRDRDIILNAIEDAMVASGQRFMDLKKG